MEIWQITILLLICGYSALGFFLGFRKTHYRKNPYGLTPLLNPLGAFVWADAVVFGIFFFLSSIIALTARNFTLFLLIYSVFWVVRSIGEQIYWFLEQFAEKHRNRPQNLHMSKYYPGESVYIHHQIYWQCVSVISIIFSVYFFVQFLTQQ